MSAFEELGVCPEIIHAIQEDDWLLPSAVQAEAIPLILGGGDICVAAETGSGKTGAFGLPCLQVVHEMLRNKAMANKTKAPTGNVGNVRLDVNDKDMYVLITEDGTECKSQEEKAWSGIRANSDVLKGKYMFEVEVLSEGLVRVGWGTAISHLALGTDDKSFGYGATGKKSWNNSFEDYGRAYTKGDVVACLLDRSAGTLGFALNGEELGIGYSIPETLRDTGLKPGVCGKTFHVRLNFTTMTYPIPGYSPIGSLCIGDTSRGVDLAAGGKRRALLALVLEPTRDLAQQTYKCLMQFGKYLSAPELRVGLFVGGVDDRTQRKSLQEGVDICVGTLSKIMDYIRKKELDLNSLKFLILDEADDLIKNDDNKDIPKLKRLSSSSVQTLFFSATLHSTEAKRGIEALTTLPTWVDLKGRPNIPDTVHFVTYDVDPEKGLPFTLPSSAMVSTDGVHDNDRSPNKEMELSEKIKQLKPQVLVRLADALKMESCLVFCRTNVDCNNLERYFNQLGGSRGFQGKAETGKENPYSCVVLAGMRSQEEREANLEHFKQGDVRFLICTDVAARGIDIKELPYLVMMTLPDDPEQFFHRVGRVGRADRMGLAVSLAALHHKEKVWYHKCPNRGKGCTNTRLVDQGGCTIWYDEPTYHQQIEERIGKPVPRMQPKYFTVEGIMDNLVGQTIRDTKSEDAKLGRRRETEKSCVTAVKSAKAGQMLIYGKVRDDEGTKSTIQHLEELSNAVSELRDLEIVAQKKFVRLASKVL